LLKEISHSVEFSGFAGVTTIPVEKSKYSVPLPVGIEVDTVWPDRSKDWAVF